MTSQRTSWKGIWLLTTLMRCQICFPAGRKRSSFVSVLVRLTRSRPSSHMPARRRAEVDEDGVVWPKVSYTIHYRVKPQTRKQRLARQHYRQKKFAAVERYLDYLETQTRTTVRRPRQVKRSSRGSPQRRYTIRRSTTRKTTPRKATPRETTPRKTTGTKNAVHYSSTYYIPPGATPAELMEAPLDTPKKTYKTTLYIPAKMKTTSAEIQETPDRSFHMGAGLDSDDPQNEYD